MLEDVGVLGEAHEDVGEEGGGGVAAGEEDGNEMGAEFDGVAGGFYEGVEEDVFLFLVRRGGLGPRFVFGEGELHVVVDEAVAALDVRPVAAEDEPGGIAEAGGRGDLGLGSVEGYAEVLLADCEGDTGGFVAWEGGELRVDAFAEEEFSGRVDG